MSRRDSRVHIAVRQNDALQEFETFKKKFLFANKQITKQNSNLSLKIEELNAHISTLYVENLRLRASEIALASQLKREKERSQRIMADAEAATLRLLEQLGAIRHSYKIPPSQLPTPDSPPTPPPPRAQRPVRSPSALRLAQQPSIPDILEDPEPHESSSEERHHKYHVLSDQSSSPSSANAFVTKAKPRNSASRLPVPARVSSPPPISAFQHIDLLYEGKKKLSRRRSGLMAFSGSEPRLRPPTPAFDTPRSVDVDDSEGSEGEGDEGTSPVYTESEKETDIKKENSEAEVHKQRKKEQKAKDVGSDGEGEAAYVSDRKERKRSKDKESLRANRLKDVTNSPRRKRTGSITDLVSEAERFPTTQDASLRTPLPPSPLTTSHDAPESYLPTPLPSSANTTPAPRLINLPTSEPESNPNGGRERRTRKSVNYAEPKLNTKMRKPDSIPTPGARPSLTSVSSQEPQSTQNTPRRRSLEYHDTTSTCSAKALREDRTSQLDPSLRTSRAASNTARRKIQLQEHYFKSDNNHSDDASEVSDDDPYDDEGDDADAEFAPSNSRGWSNVGVSRRRKSAALGNSAKLTVEASEKRRRSAVA